MNPASAPRWPRRIILLAFTLSGVSGLIYELVGSRRSTLICGSPPLAVSPVRAALMGGLALGSYLLGRVADRRSETALFTYGLLEVGLTLYALLMPLLFRLVEALYLAAYPGLESAPSIFFFLQFLLTAAVIVPPSVLMGGTLPMLSLAAGGAALVLDGSLPLRRGPVRAEKPRPPAAPAGVNVLLLGTALSGFAAMVYEVVWTRVLGLVLGSSVYAFGMMLLLFLAGLAAGSALFSRLRLTAGQSALAFAAAEAGIAAAGVAAVALIPRLPFLFMRAFPLIQHSFFQQQLAGLILAGLTLFPAAVCFGLAFPAVVAATTASPRPVGRGVGSVAALNMIGTVGGAFLTGFVLIPQLGLRAALLLGVGAVLVAGGAALWTAAPPPRRGPRGHPAPAAGPARPGPRRPPAARTSSSTKTGSAPPSPWTGRGTCASTASTARPTPPRIRGTWRTSCSSATCRCCSIPRRRTSSSSGWGRGSRRRRWRAIPSGRSTSWISNPPRARRRASSNRKTGASWPTRACGCWSRMDAMPCWPGRAPTTSSSPILPTSG